MEKRVLRVALEKGRFITPKALCKVQIVSMHNLL